MEAAAFEVSRFTAAAFAGALLLGSGGSKLADFRGAWIGVLDYRFVPWYLARPIAAWLVVSELTLGVGLVLSMPIAFSLAILFLAVVTIVATSALIRGLLIDCHCGGREAPLSMRTLGRNVILILALLGLLLASANSPPLKMAALDADLSLVFSVGVVTATALILYSAIKVMPARQKNSSLKGARLT